MPILLYTYFWVCTVVAGLHIHQLRMVGRGSARPYYHKIFTVKQKPLSVNLSHVSIKSYLDPSIHSQSGFHPARMSPGLSFYITHPAMWQNCGQVVGQVCPLIQNDKFSLGLLPRDSTWQKEPATSQAGKGHNWIGTQERWLRQGQCS